MKVGDTVELSPGIMHRTPQRRGVIESTRGRLFQVKFDSSKLWFEKYHLKLIPPLQLLAEEAE